MLRVRTLGRFFLATGAQITPTSVPKIKNKQKASFHVLAVAIEILPFLPRNSVWT